MLDDDKRGPWQAMIYGMLMVSARANGHDRYRSEKECKQLLIKHGFVDVQSHQNPVLFFPGGVFARKP